MSDSVSTPTPTIPGLLSGLSYGFPLEGAIRTGYMTTARNQKRVPQRDDEFRITRQFKQPDGNWAPHPLDETLRQKYGEPAEGGAGAKKLRKIPVVIAFDNPDLTVSTEYTAFSSDEKTRGRPVCSGNGSRARRKDLTTGVITEVECSPGLCQFGIENRCEALVRTTVLIEGQDHESAGFILRSGSYNAMTNLRHTLQSLKDACGGLAGAPMWLALEGKSSAMSHQSTFWYGMLYHRHPNSMEMARAIKKRRDQEQEAGFNRSAYEASILAMRNNGGMGLSVIENPEDLDQMEDLIAARFLVPGEEGQREVRVSGPSSAQQEIQNLQRRLKVGLGSALSVRESATEKGHSAQDAAGEPQVASAADEANPPAQAAA